MLIAPKQLTLDILNEIEMTPNSTDFNESNASDEAYTDWGSIKLVLDVLKKIDIDPCTFEVESEDGLRTNRLNAETCFTKERNALAQKTWNPLSIPNATCFMNPPYSRGNQQAFLKKLIEQIEKGHILEAITLTLGGVLHNEGTRQLVQECQAIAMAGRLKFVDKNNNFKGISNPRDHVFCYFGKNPNKFIEVFGEHYPVWKPIKKISSFNTFTQL